MWKTFALALTLVLLSGGTAQAAPPAECQSLRGKAYSDCLYNDLDERLRALEGEPTESPSPSPTTASPSPSPTVTSASPTTPGSPSGQAMPTSAPAGWTRIFADDFTTDQARGSWPGAYASTWYGYDCDAWGDPDGCDTTNIGDYSRDEVVSASDGMMHYLFHTGADGLPKVAAEGPKVDGEENGMVHGRYAVRWRVESLPRYGAAFLLWPVASPGHPGGNWEEGEIDYPEGAFDGDIEAFNHCVGDPQRNCAAYDTGVAMASGWHTSVIEWKAGSIEFFLDGRSIGRTTTSIPTAKMRWVLQTGVTMEGVKPAAATRGNLDIDWVTIEKPATTSSPSPTQTSTSTPPASGDWLSGAAGTEAANGTFGTWRGSPVEIGTFWVNDPALYPIGPDIAGCGDCGMWRGYPGPVNISATAKTWKGWASEADGVNDAHWTALARKAKELRTGKGQVYINPYYEFNGDWMPYSVTRTSAGQSDFRRAFERTSAILRREFPGVKVVLNPAAGRTLPTEMRPALTSFDVLGIDTYNEWPHCATTSCTGTQINRVETLRQQALAWGKPVAFPEWGNAAANGGGGGGESPAFIDAFHGYLAKHAGTGPGEVLFDTYFNIGGYPGRFELYLNGTVNPLMPQTAARYRERF